MSILIAIALKSTAVLAIGLALGWILYRRGPAHALACYKAATIAVVASLAFCFFPSPLQKHAINLPVQEAPPAVVVVSTLAGASEPEPPVKPPHRVLGSGAKPIVTPRPSAPAATSVPDLPTPVSKWELSYPQLIGIVWAAIALALLIKIGLLEAALARLKARSRLVDSGPAFYALSRIAERRGSPLPDLATHSTVKSPYLAGIVSPTIYIPENLIDGATQTLNIVFEHEMFHLQNRDCAWRLFERILCAVLWPNPLVWLVCKRIDRASEELCDQLVIESGYSPESYAKALWELSVDKKARFAALSAGVGGVRSVIGKRVQRILASSKQLASRVSSGMRWLISGLVAAAVLSTALFFTVTGYAHADTLPPIGQQVPTVKDLTVKVRTADGRAVQNASVWLIKVGEGQAIATRKQADSNGEAVYPQVSREMEGTWEVMVTAPKYGLGFARFALDDSSCEVTMNAPQTVVLHVIDPTGGPGRGVKLAATLFFVQSPGSTGFLNLEGLDIAPKSTADANGTATFENMPANTTIRFEPTDDRYCQIGPDQNIQTKASGITSVALLLQTGAFIEGAVTENGRPVQGIRIGAQTHPPGGWGNSITDAKGHYRLSQLTPGVYNVAADLTAVESQDWAAVAQTDVRLNRGETKSGIDLQLIHGGLIDGQLEDTNGNPVAGLPVGVYGPARPHSGAWVQSVVSDQKGRFRFRVPAGSQYVYAMMSRPSPAPSVTIDVRDGEITTVHLVANPPKQVPIRGVVSDASGGPVPDAVVSSTAASDGFMSEGPTSTTNSMGEFTLQCDDDEFPLIIRAQKGESATANAVTASDGSPLHIVLQDHEMASVEGQVLSPGGKPIANATVGLLEWQGDMGSANGRNTCKTDQAGRYHIDGLWPDQRFSLEIRAQGYGVAQPDHLAPGPHTVSMPPATLPIANSFIEGRIIDENGHPVPDVNVMADPYVQEPHQTGEDGKFRFDSIPNGKVNVRAFLERRFVERSVQTGQDVELVLKSAPSRPTPPPAKSTSPVGAQAIEIRTDGWVNSVPMTLAGLRGKVVVLDFWAVWCGPCNRELPKVEALAKSFGGEPVVVVGIHDSTAIPSELQKFAAAKGLTYPLAIDQRSTDGFGLTANAYGIQGIPTLVVIDKQGKIAAYTDAEEADPLVRKLLKQ